MPGVVRNLPVLEATARGVGVFTLLPEQDGIVRRVPAVVAVEGRLRPALMLELLRVATGQETLLVKSDAAGIKSVVVAGIEIPPDHEGGIWVRYGPPDRGQYVSPGPVRGDRKTGGWGKGC